MKIIQILFVLIFLSSLTQAQYVADYTVKNLFDGTAWEDSVITHPDSGFYALYTQKSYTNIYSREMKMDKNGGDIYITMRRDTTAAGSGVSEIYIGLWRGYGFPDRTGWEWHRLKQFTGQETAEAVLTDSLWFYSKMTSKYKFKIKINDAKPFYHVIESHVFKWKR